MSKVTEQEIGTVLSIISRLDSPEQLTRIRLSMTAAQTNLGRRLVQSIRVGARVEWNGKVGHQTGTVLKVKQKYVEVKADIPPGSHAIGMTWNVPASMLSVLL